MDMSREEFFTEAARQLREEDLTAERVSPFINRQATLIRTALVLTAGTRSQSILDVADELGTLLAASAAERGELPEAYLEACRTFPRRVAEAMVQLDPSYARPMTPQEAQGAHMETEAYLLQTALGIPIQPVQVLADDTVIIGVGSVGD